MSEEKVLTKEIADEILEGFNGENSWSATREYDAILDLSDFTTLDNGIGEFLNEYSFDEVDYEAYQWFGDGLFDAVIDLSGLSDLSPKEAESLSRHKGDLVLNGLTEMSTEIAWRLSEHNGGTLYLEGLKVLSQGAAMFLRRHRDLRVTLESLPESIRWIFTPGADSSTDEIMSLVTDMWGTLSSKHRNEVKRILCFNKATILTEAIVDELLAKNNFECIGEFTKVADGAAQKLAKHEGEIELSGLTELSDAAAESLSKHEGALYLSDLTELSDAAAESLSKHEGELFLGGLTELSDAAAESLSKHSGELSLSSLTEISDAAAESLSKHEGALYLSDLTELSDAAAESLSKHEGELFLGGLTELSDAAAESLSIQEQHRMSEINAMLSQAETLKDEGKFDESIALLLEILEEDPQHAICHFTLAVLYGKVDQHDKAVEHGETAVALDPTDPFSYTAMSVTYHRAYAGTDDHSYITKAEDAMEKSRQVAQQQHTPGQGPSC